MFTLKNLFRCGGPVSIRQARFFSQTAQVDRIENVFIIGSDLMAREIAQSCALAGKFRSIVISDPDLSNQELVDVQKSITANLTRMVQKIKLKESVAEIGDRIALSPGYLPNHNSNLLVIESLYDLELKQKVLKDLSEHTKASTSSIILSNNSNWQIDKIGKYIEDKERYAGLRFFSPVEDSVKASEFIILLTLCFGFKTMVYPDLFASLDRIYQRIEQGPTVKLIRNEFNAIVSSQNEAILNCASQFSSSVQMPDSKHFEAKDLFSDLDSTYTSITNKAKRQFSRFLPESTLKITCTEDTTNDTLKLIRQFANDIDKECIVERE